MNRSKPIFVSSFRDVRVCMSTKSKTSNHYDTLNVSQESTQEEIKSAYYDLTKKYHPDRNTSQEAKTKFQNVSAAYEILGNFHKRKMYDRDLMARGAAATKNTSYTVPEDKMSGFYRSRSFNANPTKSTDNFRNYDFDAWTKAHYGSTLRKQLNRQREIRELKEENLKEKRREEADIRTTARFTTLIMTLLMMSFMLQSLTSKDYDTPALQKKS